MNKDLFQLLNTVRVIDVLVTSLLFILIISFVVAQRKNIRKLLEHWREKRNFEDTIMKSVNANTDKINYLETTMLKARDTSKNIRAKMNNDIDEIVSDVKTIIGTLDKMQEREEASKRADIKDKIEKIYRECSMAKKCTDMQLDTLKDLIEDYERHNGENSFVHSVVQKEMYTWDVIKKIPNS